MQAANHSGHHAPLTVHAALAIVVMEFAIFATNLATLAGAMWFFAPMGGLVAGCAVVGYQLRYSHDSHNLAIAKGVLSALVVATPMPLLGSLLAIVCVAWNLVQRPSHG